MPFRPDIRLGAEHRQDIQAVYCRFLTVPKDPEVPVKKPHVLLRSSHCLVSISLKGLDFTCVNKDELYFNFRP